MGEVSIMVFSLAETAANETYGFFFRAFFFPWAEGEKRSKGKKPQVSSR
jgi:hypothetical protein